MLAFFLPPRLFVTANTKSTECVGKFLETAGALARHPRPTLPPADGEGETPTPMMFITSERDYTGILERTTLGSWPCRHLLSPPRNGFFVFLDRCCSKTPKLNTIYTLCGVAWSSSEKSALNLYELLGNNLGSLSLSLKLWHWWSNIPGEKMPLKSVHIYNPQGDSALRRYFHEHAFSVSRWTTCFSGPLNQAFLKEKGDLRRTPFRLAFESKFATPMSLYTNYESEALGGWVQDDEEEDWYVVGQAQDIMWILS